MKIRVILMVLGVLLIGSMACSAIPFLAPTATPTVTLTPTLTPTLTSTATRTLTPTLTRTLTPTKITGIEAPVMVGDAKLQFRKALRRATYVCGDSTTPADNPDTEEYLLVTANILTGPTLSTDQDVTDWADHNNIFQFEVVDNNNQFSDITSFCYSRDTKGVLLSVDFPFVIQKDATSFVLILPDSTEIPLDSIL